MRTRIGWFAVLAAMLVCVSPLAAQDAQVPWRLSYFPYFTVSPNDGLMGIARAIWFRQAPWGERVTLQNSVAVEAGYSTRDAWLARVTWDNPTLAPDWRLKAHLEAGRTARFGEIDVDPSLRHDRQVAWVDLTRRLRGPLHFALRGGWRHDEFTDAASGDSFDDTDLSVRGALVLDLRDREYEVNSGALLEFGGIAGTGGDNYEAPYAQARGWLRPAIPLRLTGRFAWRGATDGVALAPSFEFPAWEQPFTTMGGPHAVRGLPIGAGAGDGVLLVGAEARLDIINVGELGAVTVIGFLDGGKRLSGGDDLTTEVSLVRPRLESVARLPDYGDWTWSPGGGIAIRVLRAAILNVTAAHADGHTRWYVSSGWSW